MLKRLEPSGFKSFAKKSVLEFNAPISAIVGPNGSGKSNVAESLRFVLGEQSIKSMRGKKGEDLIWNGSSGVPRSGRASVKVIFDNRKKIFNLDYEEVSIERVVHRDGTNEYLINGSQVRLKDVLELLSEANIGSSGHHIISQGEADRILNVSAKDRKNIIEDALGLKIYQYKKEESLRKLSKTEENIKSVESLRREIAPHIRFLKKQVEKIEKTEILKKNLKDLYQEYFRRESIYLKLNRSRIAEEKREPEEKMARLEAELSNAKSILEKGEGSGRMDDLALYEKEYEAKRSETSVITRDLNRIDGQISSAEKNLARQKEFISRQAATTVRISEIEELASEIDQMSQEADSSSDLGFLKNIVKNIGNLVRGFIEKSTGPAVEDNEMVKEIATEIESLIRERKNLQEKLNIFREEEKKAEEKYREARQRIEEEKDSYKDAEKEVYRIMAMQNEVRGILNSLSLKEEKITLEAEEYERELAEAAVLSGREALDFDNIEIRDNGNVLSNEQIAFSPRKEQEERKKELEKIKIRLEDQGVSGSDDIMKEYKETLERDEFLGRELEDLLKSAESLKNLINDLEEKLNTEFKNGLTKINAEFKKYFTMMFGGGEASLSVTEKTKRKKRDIDLDLDMDEIPEEEEVEEGIDINVSLPHKKIKGLMMLSGGERALASIALLFAISQVNPPPFIVLDETDAALDEANSRKYADMVKALSEHSQLILITHNRETMNAAGILYGVTMGSDGVSKLLSVSFDEATNYAK